MATNPTSYFLPLIPQAEKVTVNLNGIDYKLSTRFNNPYGCWTMDISDTNNNLIIGSLPLVTGLNLLEQYEYLAIGGGGSLVVVPTTVEPNAVDDVPTFQNLGITAQVSFFLPGT